MGKWFWSKCPCCCYFCGNTLIFLHLCEVSFQAGSKGHVIQWIWKMTTSFVKSSSIKTQFVRTHINVCCPQILSWTMTCIVFLHPCSCTRTSLDSSTSSQAQAQAQVELKINTKHRSGKMWFLLSEVHVVFYPLNCLRGKEWGKHWVHIWIYYWAADVQAASAHCSTMNPPESSPWRCFIHT